MAIINGRGTVGIRRGTVIGPQFNPDAQAFITAANITDVTQQNAINTLVLSLKSAGIWTKMKAIYPFVGGTPSSHKFNLKDPRDDNGAYRLTFGVGLTHSQNGINGNGTGYANTFLKPSTTLTSFNSHLSVYTRTNSPTDTGIDIGVYENIPSNHFLQTYSTGLNGSRSSIQRNNSDYAIFTPTTKIGFFMGQSLSSNIQKIYQNGLLKNTNTTVNNLPLIPYNIYIGCLNNMDSPLAFSAREIAFASIGDGLTDTEASNLYTAVQTYQTSLSRNV